MNIKWLFALLLCFSLDSRAALVSDLYTAEVPIADHSTEAREEAVKSALSQVLVKVSGNSNIILIPAVSSTLSSANTQIQSYAYVKHNQTQQESLQVKFTPEGVNQLLSRTHQTIWDSHRPLSAVWLIMGESANAHIVTSDEGNALVEEMLLQANRRGVPLVLPGKDLNNVPALVERVVNMDTQQLLTASKQYNAENFLGIKLKPLESGEFEADCIFFSKGRSLRWKVTEKDQALVAKKIIDRFSNELSDQFVAQKGINNQKPVMFSVAGIVDLNDYDSIYHYLQKLTPVTNVEMVKIEGDTVVFAILVGDGEQGLSQAISEQPELKYSWQVIHT